MITLYSYPELFGVADNNPYGLKVFAFLKFCGLLFRHEHLFDTKQAPRGQLPYIADDGRLIGDSDAIISHLIHKYDLDVDKALTPAQRDVSLLIRRALDDLYWVMSYSRWSDERYWPQFRDAFLQTHSAVTAEMLEAARTYNIQRYHYQGIGRYNVEEVYERGVADLETLAHLLPPSGHLFGPTPGSADAGLYGFVANIYFYKIETPLKACVASNPNLVRHCQILHAAVANASGAIDALGTA